MPQALNHRTARRSVEDVGRHSLSAWNYSQIVTTNSNQEVIDQMKPTVGAISFSGAVNTDLKYMWSWHNQDHSYIDLSNNSWNNFGQEWINPNVLVIVNNDNNNEDQIRIYYDNGDAIEINDEIDFTFNGRTLNIPKKMLLI
jgi:predicted ATP-grasp superfamily ATP-dependent carboligase